MPTKVTIIGKRSFNSNKTGKPCYMIVWSQPFSGDNSEGSAAYTSFVKVDLFDKVKVGVIYQAIVFHSDNNHQFYIV